VRGAEDVDFIGVLDAREEVGLASVDDIDALLDRAERLIRRHGPPFDAIVGHWDVPVSTMLPILRRRLGIDNGPTLEAVLRCEHKYWSRCEQREVVPDIVPDFELVDPFAPHALRLPYPFWIKPIKAHSSFLGFRIADDAALERALQVTRERIDRVAVPFDQLLRHADLPPEIAAANGSHCIAEGLIGGHQCTLEGYVFAGRPHVYGVVDSLRYPNGSSFARYQYPSKLPRPVQQRMIDAIARVLRHIEFDESPFNAEFFWDEDDDTIGLLEINPRISQSHCFQFESVHGRSHHEVMVDCGLGREPHYGDTAGRYRMAAKFMVREEQDGVITRAPTEQELARIEREIPGTHVRCLVDEGMRLSEHDVQDSYLYQVAQIYVAADDEDELEEKYRACLRGMNLRMRPDASGGTKMVCPPASVEAR
jgi:hypothetical protein